MSGIEDATYRRDEYQEVVSGMWGYGGAGASARQYSQQQFGVGNRCCELDVVVVVSPTGGDHDESSCPVPPRGMPMRLSRTSFSMNASLIATHRTPSAPEQLFPRTARETSDL
jgi:hypothetical protein